MDLVHMMRVFWILLFWGAFYSFGNVEVGLDRLFQGDCHPLLKGKRVGVITNQTGINRKGKTTVDLFLQPTKEFKLVAFFAPEHGLKGELYAAEKVKDEKINGVPVHSLHGKTRRPSQEHLKEIDVLVYDIQDIGTRPYTYASTLFYAMEEAVKANVEVVVLDRPNPISGKIVDGPMLEEKWRSFIGYINVPYIHGMTIGELAEFFNKEYKIGAKLHVITMKGWKRGMFFQDTGLLWVPPSPNIPEPESPFFAATTGLLGELRLCNIGIGYTLPFKVVGASWLDGKRLADQLNQQGLSGVHFHPIHYKPTAGSMAKKECHGVLIQITNKKAYRPFVVQGIILGLLKSLYPEKITEALKNITKTEKDLFCKAAGTEEIFKLLKDGKLIAWKLAELKRSERELFMETRKKYLRPEYEETIDQIYEEKIDHR